MFPKEMRKDRQVSSDRVIPFVLGRLALVVNAERDDALDTAREVREWGKNNNVTVVEEDQLGGADASSIDLLVSLGGDGTVLRALHLLNGAAVPVLGVNFGTLGYLTTIEPQQLLEVLSQLHAGAVPANSSIEERMMLGVEVTHVDGSMHTLRALNEMVVEKVESGHTVRLEVAIDGNIFATYSADGVIVATPTGSTAYSLSARGPVVSPQHRAMILTPVSPHMLFDRALVLDPSEDITITVRGHRGVSLAVDGLLFVEMAAGDVARVTSDAKNARFLQIGSPRFHQILREKFGLGAD